MGKSRMKVVPRPGSLSKRMHDAVAHRQPQTGPFPFLLRREERLEDVRLRVGADPGTGVRNARLDAPLRAPGLDLEPAVFPLLADRLL